MAELPVMEVGQLVFHQGRFWSVKPIEAASIPSAEALLILRPEVAADAQPPRPTH